MKFSWKKNLLSVPSLAACWAHAGIVGQRENPSTTWGAQKKGGVVPSCGGDCQACSLPVQGHVCMSTCCGPRLITTGLNLTCCSFSFSSSHIWMYHFYHFYHYLLFVLFVNVNTIFKTNMSVSCSVVCDSLWPDGLQPASLLCPWNSPGKNTGVGCIPLSRGSSGLRDWIQVSCIAGRFFYRLSYQGSPKYECSVQFRSVAKSCPTLCDPMNRSMPGLPVHHQLPEFTQIHIYRVSIRTAKFSCKL